jgi:hypothetical protein
MASKNALAIAEAEFREDVIARLELIYLMLDQLMGEAGLAGVALAIPDDNAATEPPGDDLGAPALDGAAVSQVVAEQSDAPSDEAAPKRKGRD